MTYNSQKQKQFQDLEHEMKSKSDQTIQKKQENEQKKVEFIQRDKVKFKKEMMEKKLYEEKWKKEMAEKKYQRIWSAKMFNDLRRHDNYERADDYFN